MSFDSNIRSFPDGARSDARDDDARSRALLGFQSGKELWLVNLADSGEIVPCPPLTPVPLTLPWFCGLANVRGTLYSVTDFSVFHNGPPTPRNNDARLLLIGARFGINCALLVSRTLGLRNLEQFEQRAAAQDSRPWVGNVYADHRGHLWTTLRVAPLLSDPAFLEVGR
jgi:twitching motility protein PilI